MKLSCLYSNKSELFRSIRFREGLNVILGNVRRPEERTEDVHNLGKTLLGQLIDFCLLRRKDPAFFLFKHQERFEEVVFFLEIKTHDEKYITVRRSVARGTKISFMHHLSPHQDFTNTPEASWDHWEVPFERAKQLMDGILDLTAISTWSFRNIIAYSLRTQRDYDNPFKLAKFAGKHRDWKPLLAHLLGLDGLLVQRSYDLQEEITKKQQEVSRLRTEAQGIENWDQLRGLINIREEEVEFFQSQLDTYDFGILDEEINKELVTELDSRLSDLNERRYYLDSARERTESAIEDSAEFDFERIKKLFEQSQVYFGDQLIKDFEELVQFNKALTEERNYYLKEELKHLQAELENVRSEISELNEQRSKALAVLKDRESFSKYRQFTQELVEKKTDLASLRRQEEAVEKLIEARKEEQEKTRELQKIQEDIESNIRNQSERYKSIRHWFNDIVKSVINENAVLYIRQNQEGNPEFKVDLVDEKGKYTSGSEGYSYSRLLCIAFDLALQRTYINERYPHFIYHDGILESVDDRRKLNLIEVIRDYAATGIQHIITVIDSELPYYSDNTRFSFNESEIILYLHDQDMSGRLFRMEPW